MIKFTITALKINIDIDDVYSLNGTMNKEKLENMILGKLEKKENQTYFHLVENTEYFLNHIITGLPESVKDKMNKFTYEIILSVDFGKAVIKMMTPIGVLTTEPFTF